MPLHDDLQMIERQEKVLSFASFDEGTAWELGSELRKAGVQREHPLVVDIRRFGHRLFFAALPGSTPDNAHWARRKGNTVARFHRSSYGMGLDLQSKKTTLSERFGLTLKRYAAHGGAFPITLAGTGVIGSVAVSGLPQRQDHELVVEVLCSLLHHDYAALRLP